MGSSALRLDPIPARREAALRWLDARIDYERARMVPYRAQEFKLARMRELLRWLSNPEQQLSLIHVAGTKGKGSTAAMIGAVLSAAGYRTGVFTSPHLDRLEQRMAVDGRPCAAAELTELIEGVMPAAQRMDEAAARCGPPEIGPTYFEIATALALLHFARRHVDAAVLEVGLGGRLDSTNVCRPRVSVITSISFDHTRQLGNTLESIAREKAGIIKPGVPIISGVTESGPREVIRRICRQRDCRLAELGVDFDFTYRPPREWQRDAVPGRLDFRQRAGDGRPRYADLSLGPLGRHQAANAALALAALGEMARLGWEIPEQAVRRGLAEVACPARIEVVARRPAVVVDAAHNVASVEALLRVLQESFSARRRLLVFAASQEKDVRGMLGRLLEHFDEVVFTRYLDNPRNVPPEELQAIAAELTGRRYPSCADPAEAWKLIPKMVTPDDLICITGSFFIAAEMRRLITQGHP